MIELLDSISHRDGLEQLMFSPVELKTFLTLVETMSFTRTAEELGLAQPTVSLHIRKLELEANVTLLTRSENGVRSVRPTQAGRALVDLARSILATHAKAVDYFRPDPVAGRVRFAMADDLTSPRIAGILREFKRLHPNVIVEITVGQSSLLQRRLRAEQFELALVKRYPADTSGAVLLRDRLVWVAHPDVDFSEASPLPLILYPSSSFSRNAAIHILDEARRPWRIANMVRGVNGAITTTRAGIGVTVMARSVVPPDLIEVGPSLLLPALGDVDLVLLESPSARREVTGALIDAIVKEHGGVID